MLIQNMATANMLYQFHWAYNDFFTLMRNAKNGRLLQAIHNTVDWHVLFYFSKDRYEYETHDGEGRFVVPRELNKDWLTEHECIAKES